VVGMSCSRMSCKICQSDNQRNLGRSCYSFPDSKTWTSRPSSSFRPSGLFELRLHGVCS
jgi:hypothetical protein